MINKKEVQHIAELARISLKESEIKGFQKDLSLVLDYFDILKKVDVSKIEPTFHPAENFSKRELEKMRKDEAMPVLPEIVKELIRLAPDKKDGFIKVKSVF